MILGVDFLHKNVLVLEFAETPPIIHPACVHPPLPAKKCLDREQVHSMYKDMYKDMYKTGRGGYTSAVIEQPGTDVIDECAVPIFPGPGSIELPECPRPGLMSVVQEYKDLFQTTPRVTEAAHHFIPTTGNPVRVPPRRIPAHYRKEVEKQIQTVLEQGII